MKGAFLQKAKCVEIVVPNDASEFFTAPCLCFGFKADEQRFADAHALAAHMKADDMASVVLNVIREQSDRFAVHFRNPSGKG